MEESMAVCVKNACKSYGKNPVLQNLNLHIQRGNIYGLLGASGCGKTTLLTCMVARKTLDSGEMWVLGNQYKESGVLGPKVGFMPQELGLVGWLTIKDTIYYFGRIMNMPEKLIAQRYDILEKVLDLPPSDQYVMHCSGGQQRRVSFAATLVHMPELLILDEPTVGMDPVLREKIWAFLMKLSKEENMAVIITTHYIDEARQADVIGIMRNGRLLAEEPPMVLLNHFQTDYLEEVFLILSQRQESGNLELTPSNLRASTCSIGTVSDILIQSHKKETKTPSLVELWVNRKRMRALMDKNWKQFYRNYINSVFLLVFPLFVITAFLAAVGADVKDIKIAVVNDESKCNTTSTQRAVLNPETYRCDLENLSCRFLSYLKDPMIDIVPYQSLDQSYDDIRHGAIVGVIQMDDNFTQAYQARREDGRDFQQEYLNNSQIKVWLDMSNRQIGESVKFRLQYLFYKFQKDLAKDCQEEPKSVELVALNILNGAIDDTATDFMAPGVIMTVMFFGGTLLTGVIIINERQDGVWDRAVIAGVTSLEIVLSHFSFHSVIVIVYTVEVLTMTFGVFGVKYVGSMVLMFFLVYLQGICGLNFGLWISVISKDFVTCMVVASGFFYGMILTCGLMWPWQGMPTWLQYVAKSLPFTLPMDSMRYIVKRAWTIEYQEIAIAFLIEIAWIVGLVVFSTFLIRRSR